MHVNALIAASLPFSRHALVGQKLTQFLTHFTRPVWTSKLSTLAQRIPAGAWDSHMHVVDPERYPLSPTAQYRPHAHGLADYARVIGADLGIKNAVLVQPSIYGTDNSCLLDALRELTPKHGRGVVEIDPAVITQGQLEEWHSIGVRGVRVNLKSVGKVLSQQELRAELSRYADVIRPLDWVLQIYLPLSMVSYLEPVVPDLGVKFCIDHFGSPELSPTFDPANPLDPNSLPGFDSLLNLLKSGTTWVKISAPYRLTKDPRMRDLEIVAKTFMRHARDRVVYSTDWPHTRFENIDPKPFAEFLLQWCNGNQSLVRRLFRTNAEKLWDVESNMAT
jgi:predicted TIM-barrel fold metal-dependent hydrolase